MKRFIPDIKSKFSYAWKLFIGPTRLFSSIYKQNIDVHKVYNVPPLINEIIYLYLIAATLVATIVLPTVYLAVMVPYTVIKHAITNFVNTALYAYNAFKSKILGKKAQIEVPEQDFDENTAMFSFTVIKPEPVITLRSNPTLIENRDNNANIGNTELNTNVLKGPNL